MSIDARQLAELADPTKVTCINCGRWIRERQIMSSSLYMSVRDPERLFCTLRCGFDYGLKVARAQMRGELVPAPKKGAKP